MFYRGRVPRETEFPAHAAFVSFFPQLVAGPIERARQPPAPVADKRPRITREDITDGLSLFLVGLFKKVALADYLALYVDQVYAARGQFDAPALILATFAFAWQIYFDFSGYTDMARGIARADGLPPDAELQQSLPRPPAWATSGRAGTSACRSWFQDYVYIPLGGNRRAARHLPEHVPDDGHLGPLARRGLDVRHLGRPARPGHLPPASWSGRPSTRIGCPGWSSSCWSSPSSPSPGSSSGPRASRRPGPLLCILTSGRVQPVLSLAGPGLDRSGVDLSVFFRLLPGWLLEAGVVRVALVLAMLVYMLLTVGGEGQQFIYMQF